MCHWTKSQGGPHNSCTLIVTLQLSVGDHSFRIRVGSLEKPCSGTLEQWPRGIDTLKQIALSTRLRYPSLKRSAWQGFGGEPILIQPPPVTEGLLLMANIN